MALPILRSMAKIPVTEGFYVEDHERRERIETDGIEPDPFVADTVVLFRELKAAKTWAASLAENASAPATGPTVFIWKVDTTGLGAEYTDDLDGRGPDVELGGPEMVPPDRLTLVWSA